MAVIGGGLAGITAAIALAEAGAAVTLLEARPRLGGATCSFNRDGLTVDTGQHIFLGCCTAYRDLLGRLGMTEHAPIQDRFDVSVLAPGPIPRRGRLRRTALPGPLHMLPALGRYPFLSLSERTSVARPALAMRFVDPARPGVDEQRFGDWLAARGQSERARRALWDLFTVSALNIAGDDASLSLAATVVKTGLLGKNNAADIGVPALPLGELHGDAGATLLTKLGAQVLLNAKVAAIEPPPHPRNPACSASNARFRVHLARPASDSPDAASAASPSAAEPVRGRDRDPRGRRGPGRPARGRRPPDPARRAARRDRRGLGGPGRLAHRQRARDLRPPRDGPALRRRHRLARPVGLRPHPYLRPRPPRTGLDRPSPPPHPFPPAPPAPEPPQPNEPRVSPRSNEVNPGVHSAAAVSADPADAAHDASGAHGAQDAALRPQYLAISLSAADEYVDVPAAVLREQFVPALAELFPAAREAQVTEFFVTRERRATFRQGPGTARLRPPAATNLPGLVLAGAWTATGWPDTMESAVRSGLAAAIELRRTVLSSPGHPNTGHSETGHPDADIRPGHPETGYSDSVLSGSEANAPTSTIGERQ